MNILLTIPNPENPGDKIIELGVRELIQQVNIESYTRTEIIHNHDFQFVFFRTDEPRLVIHCGTPFIWNRMGETAKYNNIKELHDRYPYTRKVMLGIGTSIPLEYVNDPWSLLRDDAHLIQEFYKNMDLIVVRDLLSHRILNDLGIESHLVACPSFFCPLPAIQAQDSKTVDMRGVEVKDHLDLLNKVCYRKKVITDRVHQAIPAFMSGAEVELIPLDSRYLTFEEGKKRNLENDRKNLVQLLREAI